MSLKFSSKTINAGTDAKTIKGNDEEWLTSIMYLAPYKLAQVGNLCPMAELAKCHEPCLNLAGRGKFNNIQNARIRKSRWFINDRPSFMDQLYKDLNKFQEFCHKHDVKPAVRLNGTSDIRWELLKHPTDKNVFEEFPNISFYDYTKIANRKIKDYKNYKLVWSYSGADKRYADMVTDAKKNNMNIAVVFRNNLPKKFLNWKVIDGDKDDLRFLDPPSRVIGLKAKGPAKKDQSGFVVDV